MAAKVIEKLTAYGCDTAAAIDRMMGSEDLYVRFLGKFLDDESFLQIKPFIDMEDNEGALKSTHTLKGVAGNLGLTPVFEIAADMVNRFRADDPEGAIAEYDLLAEKYNELYNIIRESL